MADSMAPIVVQVRIFVEHVEATPTVYAFLRQAQHDRTYVPRRGSDGERVLALLTEAGDVGLSEAQVEQKLRQQGRLSKVKHAGRSVHWILYNLQRRTRSIERDEAGRWRVVAASVDEQPS